MSIHATFEDLANPHFTENLNAYTQLKSSGKFTEEELQKLFWEQMAADELKEGKINLKPCPFCGGKAELTSKSESYGYGGNTDHYFVKCTQCNCKGTDKDTYLEKREQCIIEAVAAWQRRV